MSLHNGLRSVACCLVAVLFLLGFSGCEDQEARGRAQEASKVADQLKAEVEKLRTENAKLLEALQNIPAKLAAQIAERTDKVAEQVSASSKEVQTKVAQDSELVRKDATAIVQSARGDFDKELQNAKAAFAGDVQKIRDETKAALDDLKKYMDNQLRELYPYAYQPRRGESKAPPEPDVKN